MRRKKEGLEYLPTTGVRTDLKHFMNKYLEYKTVRYEHFVEVWRDKNMVYLCAGRATDREAREFVERVLQIAQEYFLPPYQFQVRVGGLYLLYAIYQIQPISPKVKIRLTPRQWQDTVFFQQQAAQQNHLDVVYVFQRLLQEQAFLFCYTPSEMSIHSSMKDSDEMMDDLADTLKEEKTALTSLFHYESLEKLSYLQDQYQQMKIGLAGPQATRPDKSLDVVLTELVEDVVVLLQSFKDQVSTFSRQGQKLDATKKDDGPVLETTGNRRKMLKTQAYNQLGAQTNKRQSLQAVSSSSKSPGKTTQPGSSHVAQKDMLSPVSGSSHRPASSTRLGHLADNGSSDDDHDEDYIQSRKCSSARKKMRRLAVEGDQRQVLVAVTDLTRLGPDSTAPQVSLGSMPSIEAVQPNVDSCPLSRRCLSFTRNVRREVLVEQNVRTKEPAECNQPVKKRGRPRKYPQLACLGTGDQTPTHTQTGSGQENCSQGRTPPVARNNDHNVTHGQGSVKRKIAFKHSKTGQRAEHTTARGQNVAERRTSPRRRGRLTKCDLLRKGEALGVSESTVSPDSRHNSSEKRAKYELVYFPTGTTPALEVTSCSTGWPRVSTQMNITDVESGGLSQAVQQIASTVGQTSHPSAHRAGARQTANIPYTKASKRRPASEAKSWTLTEIVVNKEVGKPAVIQSQVVHTRDKGLSSQTSLEYALPTEVAPEDGSATASRPPAVSATLEVHSVDGSNPSQPAQVLSQTDNEHDLIHLRKERCKRQLDDVGRESEAQSVKRNRAVTLLQSASTTQCKAAVLTRSPGKSPHKSLVLTRSPGKSAHKSLVLTRSPGKSPHKSLVLTRSPGKSSHKSLVLRKSVVPEDDSAAAGTPDSTAATVEASHFSQPVKVLNRKYNANDSIHRLKERCKQQLAERDRESVTQFVKRCMVQGREITLMQPVSTTQQKTAVMKQPSVQTSWEKALSREPSVKTSQHKALALREPSVTKSPQKTAAVSELLVNKSERTTVVLKHLLNGPSVKSQQNREPAVKPQQKTAVLSEPPKSVSQKEGPEKVSETRNAQTASKDMLPPWTSRRHHSPGQTTSKQHRFSPKIRPTTKVDPAEVQFRFL